MAIPTIPDIRELMEAGMHFGHASGRWHPKMKPYIFATRDKLHIINLEITREKLAEVLPVIEERVKEGKTLVLVGTKKQVSEQIKEIGERNNIPYVHVRWLGGTMTNFGEMQKSINRMKKLEEFLVSEEVNTILKKERVRMEADLERMHHKFGGLRNVSKKPDTLFIVDPSHEHNAVKEARHEGVEIIAILDTNTDPSQVDHFIPANDDAPKSLVLLLNWVEQTIQSGQKLAALKEEKQAKAEAEKDLEEAKKEATEKVVEEPTVKTPEEKVKKTKAK